MGRSCGKGVRYSAVRKHLSTNPAAERSDDWTKPQEEVKERFVNCFLTKLGGWGELCLRRRVGEADAGVQTTGGPNFKARNTPLWKRVNKWLTKVVSM